MLSELKARLSLIQLNYWATTSFENCLESENAEEEAAGAAELLPFGLVIGTMIGHVWMIEDSVSWDWKHRTHAVVSFLALAAIRNVAI